jgi:hypothetical protein
VHQQTIKRSSQASSLPISRLLLFVSSSLSFVVLWRRTMMILRHQVLQPVVLMINQAKSSKDQTRQSRRMPQQWESIKSATLAERFDRGQPRLKLRTNSPCWHCNHEAARLPVLERRLVSRLELQSFVLGLMSARFLLLLRSGLGPDPHPPSFHPHSRESHHPWPSKTRKSITHHSGTAQTGAGEI